MYKHVLSLKNCHCETHSDTDASHKVSNALERLHETAKMYEDLLFKSKGPYGCCYSRCSLYIHQEMMGLMMSLLRQFVPEVSGLTLKLGKVEGGQWNSSATSTLWAVYVERKVNQKHRRRLSWQLRQCQRDLPRNAKRSWFRERNSF